MGKRGRRKAIPCVLCGAETLSDVCFDCKQAYRVGKKVLAEREAERAANEKQFYYLPCYALNYEIRDSRIYDLSKRFGENYQSIEFRLLNFIAAMTGETPDTHRGPDNYPKWGDTEIDPHIILPEWVPGEPEAQVKYVIQHGESLRPWARVYLSERQAQAIRTLLQTMNHQIKDANNRGESNGASFVKRLARGDINMDDINRWHTRIEAVDK